MIDMIKTIEAKSNQLNSDDLQGAPITVRITKVSAGNSEQPIAINYEGDNNKPFYPCKSMRRVLVAVWGVNAAEYIGRSMTLYRDPEVKFGGIAVGGIRISHMSHMTTPITMALTATRASKKPYTVKPLKVAVSVPLHEQGEPELATLETERDVLKMAMREAAEIGEKEFIAIWVGMSADEKIALNDYKEELKQQLKEKQNG
jgi:hypothetical protein